MLLRGPDLVYCKGVLLRRLDIFYCKGVLLQRPDIFYCKGVLLQGFAARGGGRVYMSASYVCFANY